MSPRRFARPERSASRTTARSQPHWRNRSATGSNPDYWRGSRATRRLATAKSNSTPRDQRLPERHPETSRCATGACGTATRRPPRRQKTPKASAPTAIGRSPSRGIPSRPAARCSDCSRMRRARWTVRSRPPRSPGPAPPPVRARWAETAERLTPDCRSRPVTDRRPRVDPPSEPSRRPGTRPGRVANCSLVN